MKNNFGFWILALVFWLLINSCGNEITSRQESKEIKKDTSRKDSAKIVEVKKTFDRKYNDIARFIAGMPADSGSIIDSSLLHNKEWQKFSQNMEAQWMKYDSVRLRKISKWVKNEIPENKNTFKLFYPFSGPDFLNAETFFPSADTMVLVGLEPRGKISEIKKNLNDSLGKYLNKIERSLYSILNFSFFRTISMKVDLHQEEVNGTVPIMMLFLARTGNSIENVQLVYVNKSGNIMHDTITADSIKTKGVEIIFRNKTEKNQKKLFYFSVDLSNGGFQKKAPEFATFINNLGTVTTFLKSASYLMHKSYFSEIRSLILKQSNVLLQDDSGIPFSFFPDSVWDNKFYGTFSKPIPMFGMFPQEDLQKAYSDAKKVKPLDFGIGYKWKKNESNLMLSRKKKS